MPKSGFTLIEMLVVIAVMALVGTFTLSNYKSFGEDQDLKSAVLDIQSQLRTAQTNSTTNLKCEGVSDPDGPYGATWKVRFFDSTTILLKCDKPPDSLEKRTLKLGADIQIFSVSGTPAGSCPSIPPFSRFNISFTPLYGKMTIGDNTSCTSLTVTLENTKTGSTKSLVIEQGGKIYAQ